MDDRAYSSAITQLAPEEVAIIVSDKASHLGLWNFARAWMVSRKAIAPPRQRY